MKEYSRQPRKQRLAGYNKNHQDQMRSMSAHLSDELLKEYSTVRSVTVRKGDVVKVVRGNIKGHVGKVLEVFPGRGLIKLEGEEATIMKADGKRVARLFRPSKVIITKLDLSDNWRREKLEKLKQGAKPGRKERKRKPKKAKKEENAPDKKEEKKDEKAGEKAPEVKDEKKEPKAAEPAKEAPKAEPKKDEHKAPEKKEAHKAADKKEGVK
jgi:large subunit ribosomal protein L24